MAINVAAACGNDDERHVVGWNADATKALVRVEHNDDEGHIHALTLHLLSKEGWEKTWEILTTDDNSDQAIRGERWKAAEPEIAAAGIVLNPEAKPFHGCKGDCFELISKPAPIPGTEYTFALTTYRTDEAYLYNLVLSADGKSEEHVLYRGAGSGGEWGVRSLWTDPKSRAVVVLSTHNYAKAWHIIPLG